MRLQGTLPLPSLTHSDPVNWNHKAGCQACMAAVAAELAAVTFLHLSHQEETPCPSCHVRDHQSHGWNYRDFTLHSSASCLSGPVGFFGQSVIFFPHHEVCSVVGPLFDISLDVTANRLLLQAQFIMAVQFSQCCTGRQRERRCIPLNK